MTTNGKRPASSRSPTPSEEVREAESSKRPRPGQQSFSSSLAGSDAIDSTSRNAGTSTSSSTSKSVSLHQWLHPALPPPIKTHSPALHSSSSTFLSFTISFEPPTHTTSVVSLEKEVRRIVRELDVVREVGQLVMRGDEGAFSDGGGRAPGRGKGSGKDRERAREPDHRMWAVRTLGLREGKDGTGGEGDYQLLEATFDDDEKYGGQTIMRVLQEQNAVDVITICCRWYGGDMIGPIRFQHITTTALTSLKQTIKAMALRDLRTSLEGLDEEIASLRSALAAISSFMNGSDGDRDGGDGNGGGVGGGGGGGSQGEASTNTTHLTGTSHSSIVGGGGGGESGGQYDSVEDEAKLQRLVVARERTKAALEKKLASSGA
ncbi:hypothetical protein IAU59_005943 [Kwoniella sp. CBS 9459]